MEDRQGEGYLDKGGHLDSLDLIKGLRRNPDVLARGAAIGGFEAIGGGAYREKQK